MQVPVAVAPEPAVRRQLRALAAAAVCDALAGSWAGQAVVFSHQSQVCPPPGLASQASQGLCSSGAWRPPRRSVPRAPLLAALYNNYKPLSL